MVTTILAALTGPFAIAFGGTICLLIGLAAGLFIADKMEAAEQLRKKIEKQAAEDALKPPPLPQLVREEPDGPSPFEPLYVSLGDEMMSNLPARGRALLTDIALMTQRGPLAEQMMKSEVMPLRAMALSLISELSLDTATSPDGSKIMAARMLAAMNVYLRGRYNITPIDAVLVKSFYVQ